ncbi:hypothetical protein BWI93_25035 [Siphonobacter sp. BAB-5385]|nr:hypothetical protein BWI93_25035 [Siphonobacter sp. BAB-5385]
MSNHILAFPITRIDSFENLTEREAVYQLRLDAIDLINRVNAGLCLPSETNLKGLRTVNRLSREHGFEPLVFDEKACLNVQKMGYLSEE